MTIINPRKEYGPSPEIEPGTSCSQVLHASDWAVGAQIWAHGSSVDNEHLTWEIEIAGLIPGPANILFEDW